MITGASGGIGAGIARAFAVEGSRLILHYHRGAERVRELQTELGSTESLALQADLSREAEVRTLFSKARKTFGRIDTLIANAASWDVESVPLPRMTLRRWRQTIDGVLTTTFLSTREFLRVVEKQKRGNLVLVSSTAAIFGEAGHADYAAGKAAIAYGLTRSLKNEISRLAPHTATYCGGRVNCICPGWTVVPRLAAKLKDPRAIRKVTATMALPQLGRPDDMGAASVFLSSDTRARHITGQILPIAGGMDGRLLWESGEVEPQEA